MYLDRNRNGKDDAGTDPGIATIGVVLMGVDDSGRAVRLVTHTQADGTFVFDGLQPGSYSIRAPRSVKFRDFRSNAGTAGDTVVHHAIENIPIHAGMVAQTYDFGKLPKPGCRLDSWMGARRPPADAARPTDSDALPNPCRGETPPPGAAQGDVRPCGSSMMPANHPR